MKLATFIVSSTTRIRIYSVSEDLPLLTDGSIGCSARRCGIAGVRVKPRCLVVFITHYSGATVLSNLMGCNCDIRVYAVANYIPRPAPGASGCRRLSGSN
jgi:hypothetical protein